jgi:recombination protein U
MITGSCKHRGDAFETIINYANEQYKNKGIALIQKIATPMKPKRRGKDIIGAYYEEKSTLDYIGVYEGLAISFDAKETKEISGFPLSNVADHQYEFMKKWTENGGRSFLVVNFVTLNQTYRLEFYQLDWYWKQAKANPGVRGLHRIPTEEFTQNTTQLRSKNGIALDYLKGITK